MEQPPFRSLSTTGSLGFLLCQLSFGPELKSVLVYEGDVWQMFDGSTVSVTILGQNVFWFSDLVNGWVEILEGPLKPRCFLLQIASHLSCNYTGQGCALTR